MRALYGREGDLLRAEAALADWRVRVIVAAGPSGVGKSALVRRLMEQAAQKGAITGACSHGEGQSGADVFPLMQALEQAVARGLDQLYEPEAGLATLSAALGPLAGVLAPSGEGVLRRLDAASRRRPAASPRWSASTKRW